MDAALAFGGFVDGAEAERVTLWAAEELDRLTRERETYRQAALELHSEIRSALHWIDAGAEPAVAHAALLKTADKWLPLIEAAEAKREGDGGA
jgi:hypothetical protein